jgi:peptidoglycan/LPS O-acetylase OafA/YrhL
VRFPHPPTLAQAFSSRANSVGFLRLVLATSVLVAHSAPLGLGAPNFLGKETHNQADLGALGVLGFFVLSGFLITASGLRFGVGRFAWHRFLRIFPGLWACLLVTTLVLAPLVTLHEHGTLAGFWQEPHGPLTYLRGNWWTALRTAGIHDVFATTTYGKLTGGASVINGSLWSLAYELCCYILVGALAFAGVLKRSPRLVLVLVAWVYLVILGDALQEFRKGNFRPTASGHPAFGPFPFIGTIGLDTMLPLLLMFLLGAAFQLFKDRVPMHPWLLAGAGVVAVGTALTGGFVVVGLPAYAYLLIGAACYLPRWLQGVGRKRDYSYGIYIYAFPMQQLVALLVGVRYGIFAYMLMSFAAAAVLAALSWHTVERPAMLLKDWTPPLPRWRLFDRWRREPVSAPPPVSGELPPAPEPETEPVSAVRGADRVGSP